MEFLQLFPYLPRDINYLMFADDLAIIAETPGELQSAITALEKYCFANGLKVNTSKTKCMAFYRGRPPNCAFTLGKDSLEVVNTFTYLGFHLTTQLSFSAHLDAITTKANSRCGTLMSRLPLRSLPIDLVLEVYSCFVLPIFRYGISLWLTSCSDSSRNAANSSFTKFLKSYLGIPFYSNNSITHFLTGTCPLMITLENIAPHTLGSLIFPPELHGHQLSFLKINDDVKTYDPIPIIPTFFWRSKTFFSLPTTFHYRKQLCYELFDLEHAKLCTNEKFHLIDDETCTCSGCGELMRHYHKYLCTAYHHDT